MVDEEPSWLVSIKSVANTRPGVVGAVSLPAPGFFSSLLGIPSS